MRQSVTKLTREFFESNINITRYREAWRCAHIERSWCAASRNVFVENKAIRFYFLVPMRFLAQSLINSWTPVGIRNRAKLHLLLRILVCSPKSHYFTSSAWFSRLTETRKLHYYVHEARAQLLCNMLLRELSCKIATPCSGTTIKISNIVRIAENCATRYVVFKVKGKNVENKEILRTCFAYILHISDVFLMFLYFAWNK